MKLTVRGVLLLVSCLTGARLAIAADKPAGQTQPARLSDWLSSHSIGPDDYPLGLMWNVPTEIPAQQKLRAYLLQSLANARQDGASSQQIYNWVSALPVTGRVPVNIADADWLRAHPGQDPVILPGQTVTLPKRPHTITLWVSDGRRCQLPPEPGWMARDYILHCDGAALGSADWTWIIQPDGTYRRYGIAAWNVQKQNGPAPGAWIWVPLRQDDWAVELSRPLARFLSTQGIAPAPGLPSTAVPPTPSPGPRADAPDDYRDGVVTANDWGEAGLLQTPSARMRQAGMASFTFTRVSPYNRMNVFLQPFSWLEFGFRYTSIGNRPYDPRIAGNQTYKDKSTDVKFSLANESAHLPAIALGMRDFVGTGLFSSEYLVANKRFGALDASLGIGWGYLGARQDVNNPFARLNSSYSTRPASTGQAGDFTPSKYFHGRAALFGGVQYHTPWDPLILKLEYDGNNYQHEPLAENLRQSSPWNFGAVYRASPSVEITAGLERGNTFMVGVTFQTDLSKLSMPKIDDPPPVPVSPTPASYSEIGNFTAQDIHAATGWQVNSITRTGDQLNVSLDNANQIYWRKRLQRAIAILNRDASPDITTFDITYHMHGMELAAQRVDRNAWRAQQIQLLPLSEQKDPVTTTPASPTPAVNKGSQTLQQGKPDTLQLKPGLNLNYNLGGPNNFILYKVSAEGTGILRFSNSTWIQGGLQYNLFNNYGNYNFTAPSNLPRVRTNIREYQTSANLTMPSLQLTHAGKLSTNQYYSVYGGYLEMMFGGIGAEWLYRPLGSPFAFGIDVNRVRQRGFRQNFQFHTYQVTTGNATLYWDTGWNDVRATLSAGRYLAGDTGGTIQLERIFRNGVSMGGFITKTNVSAQQFGEGSFNKGIFVNIPFDAMLTRSSSSIAHFYWQPLIRDGGVMLDRQVQLYDLTKLLDERAMQYAPTSSNVNSP